MGSGVVSCSTRWAKGARGSANPLLKAVEGRAEPRTELGEGGAVGAGEGGFLLRYGRRRGLKDSIGWLVGDGMGDCICVKGSDGGFVVGGVDYTPRSVGGDSGQET